MAPPRRRCESSSRKFYPRASRKFASSSRPVTRKLTRLRQADAANDWNSSNKRSRSGTVVPGLRAGHYLCFFGMHVLTPMVMDLLQEEIAQAKDRSVHLTTALAKLAKRERYLASELQGRRYDIGVKYGLLTAQLALALNG